jgi:3-hydroxybutyryl-CoA dehydratase
MKDHRMAGPSQASPQTMFEDLAVGMSDSMTRTMTDIDIRKFAEATGDTNPIHLDEAFAAQSMFKTRIAHGMLTASHISSVFATRLPGAGCIYVSQEFRFKAPVRIGDDVTARVEVISLVPEKKFVVFKTQCLVGEKIVVEGEAVLKVPSRG